MEKSFASSLSQLPAAALSGLFSSIHSRKHDAIALEVLHRSDLAEIQQAMATLLTGFDGVQARLIKEEIFVTRDARNLWLLRSKLHLHISQLANQHDADLAINSLIPYFSGWLPERQLTEI